MGTLVTIHVVRSESAQAIDRAFGWFHEIETRCSRFQPDSELMRLSSHVGTAVAVSAILFEAVRFALLVADASGGAFNPTVGGGNYRDIELDPEQRKIKLLRPVTFDLGAVAKGLAVDAAARELEPFRDFAIDAGGDLYLGGVNEASDSWTVGIRHPRNQNELIANLKVSNQAVCTSGDYEHPRHIVDPRTGAAAQTVASATVVATGAMLADALATAAFVLGPREGIDFLNHMGVQGLLVTPDLERFEAGILPYAT